MAEIITVTYEVKDFHLTHIFDCGQCFRWNPLADGSWSGTAGGRWARMTFQPDPAKPVSSGAVCTQGVLTVTGTVAEPGETEEEFRRFWYDYLDLGRDYGMIKRSLGRGDAAMRRAIKAGPGIRILNQDLWETMVSFIISQNNNIPRIKGCIEALCRQFGEPIGVPESIFDTVRQEVTLSHDSKFPFVESKKLYTIPQPEVLAALKREDLDGCRLGYRAPYLIETAQQVLDRGGMEAVKTQLSRAEDPVAELTYFAGVGPKVASCIALFGVGRHDAFPIDVWMRRAMHTVYNIEENRVAEMQAYARDHFGKYGGFAQQYLFYYMRGL